MENKESYTDNPLYETFLSLYDSDIEDFDGTEELLIARNVNRQEDISDTEYWATLNRFDNNTKNR